MTDLSTTLRAAGLTVREVPAGLAVSHPAFVLADGDRAGCLVYGQEGEWIVSDGGDAFGDIRAYGLEPVRARSFVEDMGFGFDGENDVVGRSNILHASVPRACYEMLVLIGRVGEIGR